MFYKSSIIVFLFLIVSCGNLSTLIELSKNEKLKEQEIQRENKSFLDIKNAIINGRLKMGLKSDFILNRYGSPTLIYDLGDTYEWIYKPAGLKLDSEKIYLYFDKENKLIDYKIKE